MPFRIDYNPAAAEHLSSLTARQRATVTETVVDQLSHQPTERTRNRKPLRANPIASWELRIGDLRVYYDVAEEPEPVVVVRAVGVKVRNRVYVAGVEIKL
jgi:mRNA-degrading endonuclease RelE of RelBE toxin-antitoxin system